MVVKPAVDSKNASSGLVKTPYIKYGRAPNAIAQIQQKLAIKKPSFLLNSSIFERDLVICTAVKPTIKVRIPETKNE